jgi:hypothetical protein
MRRTHCHLRSAQMQARLPEHHDDLWSPSLVDQAERLLPNSTTTPEPTTNSASTPNHPSPTAAGPPNTDIHLHRRPDQVRSLLTNIDHDLDRQVRLELTNICGQLSQTKPGNRNSAPPKPIIPPNSPTAAPATNTSGADRPAGRRRRVRHPVSHHNVNSGRPRPLVTRPRPPIFARLTARQSE